MPLCKLPSAAGAYNYVPGGVRPAVPACFLHRFMRVSPRRLTDLFRRLEEVQERFMLPSSRWLILITLIPALTSCRRDVNLNDQMATGAAGSPATSNQSSKGGQVCPVHGLPLQSDKVRSAPPYIYGIVRTSKCYPLKAKQFPKSNLWTFDETTSLSEFGWSNVLFCTLCRAAEHRCVFQGVEEAFRPRNKEERHK